MSKSLFLLLFSFLFSCSTFGQNDTEDIAPWEKTVNKLWGNVSEQLHYGHNYHSAIDDLETIGTYTINNCDTTGWLYSMVFHAYCHKYINEPEAMKYSLDQIPAFEKLQLDDQNKTVIAASAYFVYGLYYEQEKGLIEPAIGYYQSAINTLFDYVDDINYEEIGGTDLSKLENSFAFQVADLFNNASVIYYGLGDLEKAIQYASISIALVKKEDYKKWEVAQMQQNLARIFQQLGLYPKAKGNYNEAASLLKQEKDTTNRNTVLGLFHKNIAEYYDLQGIKDSAYFHLNKAAQYKTSKAYSIYLFRTYSQILLKDKNYIEAKKKLDLAQDYILKTYGQSHPEMATNYQTRANIAVAKKQYNKADSLYNIALQILSGNTGKACNCNTIKKETIIDKRQAINIIRQKANALSQQDKNDDAIVCFQLLNDLILVLQQKYIISEESRLHFIKQSKDIYEDAIRASVKANKIETAFRFSQFSRSMLLLQQIQQKKAIAVAKLPSEMANKEQNFKIEINTLQKEREEALLSNNNMLSNQLTLKLFDANLRYENWLSGIESSYPLYYNLKYALPSVSLNEIQDHLKKEQATLIQYFQGKKNRYYFVINKDNINIFTDPFDPKFNKNIEKLHKHVSSYNNKWTEYTDYTKTAYTLYQALLGKAQKQNLLENKNLIIVADEQLNLIPFEALISQPISHKDSVIRYHKLPYLVKDYNISYYYSTNLISYFKPHKKQNASLSSFIGIAPDFSNRKLHNLEFNQAEVLAINDLFHGKTLVDTAANYYNTTQEIQKAQIAHFATHAVFNDELPLDSRIELADTALYIYEIFSLPNQLELAVISACETASGKRQKGEGVISLARAFAQSGCPSIVASLWKVSDQKTSILMHNFYRALFEGKGKGTALAEAQRTYLSESTTKNTHPFYWAGFIPIGDPSPLIHQTNFNPSYLLFLILPALVFLFLFRKYF